MRAYTIPDLRIMTTPVPRPVNTGNRVLRAAFWGIAFGYILGWIAFWIWTEVGIWLELNGRGASDRASLDNWAEGAVYGVFSLLPLWENAVWNIGGAVIGGVIATAVAVSRGVRLRSQR